MNEPIANSPWLRIIQKGFENPVNTQNLNTAEDWSPTAERAAKEAEAEIQAERRAKLKNKAE